MNSEPNDFEQLRKLLALKRHEVPPPRYFNKFSGSVIARLTTAPAESLTWWQRLGLDFDFRPALMCGVGIVVCGLLSFGVISAMQIAEPPAVAQSFEQGVMSAPMVAGMAPVAAPVEATMSIAPSIASQSTSPFNQFALKATQVGFNTSGF
jgi:hypothetical protein